MSVTDSEARPTSAEAPASPARRSTLGWGPVVLACVLLAGSGVVRAWQSERVRQELQRGLESPLALESLPLQIGPWRGEATKIDPNIARATGADQVVTRRYVNQTTGVSIDAILLFGPAVEMYVHRPENCYPSAGYVQVEGPDEKSIQAGNGKTAPFRALVYAKGEGSQTDRVEVYYTWRYNGRWTPEVGMQKQFERISGMYKVHVARRVSGKERRDIDNPNEAFLNALVQEMESRMAAAQSPAPS